jgi:FemAB-related protein (PEP-CTERM system-associated)
MKSSTLASSRPDSATAAGRGGASSVASNRLSIAYLTARHLAAWDRFVRGHPAGTFFHTVAWMHSVRDAFGHDPHYVMARRWSPGNPQGQIVGVLPLFDVRSFVGGRMLVSVPYAVAGGVIADEADTRAELWAEAQALAARLGAHTIELRSPVAAFDDLNIIGRYVNFRRRLPDRADDVLGWLPRKARAAARYAETRHGLTTEFSSSCLRTVWRLYCRSMQRLGSLSYPYRFFEELVERNRSNTFVQIVRHGRRTIAGLVSFRFNDVFLPYFVGCDTRFNRLGTNNYLYMTAMRRAVEAGCNVFDFGRTRVDNKGSYDFKRFHGFDPKPLAYQRWTADGKRPVELTPSNPAFRGVRRVWRYLPMAVCARLGSWAARHIPG